MTFSINYSNKKDSGYTELAVDWDWNIKRQWAMSDKEGVEWHTTPGLDKEAYQAILRHFGLEDYKSEFPLEKIITMSPEELGKARREKERLNGLEYITIKNDTLGEHALIP